MGPTIHHIESGVHLNFPSDVQGLWGTYQIINWQWPGPQFGRMLSGEDAPVERVFQKADECILDDGDFVTTVLKQADEQLERRCHLNMEGP